MIPEYVIPLMKTLSIDPLLHLNPNAGFIRVLESIENG